MITYVINRYEKFDCLKRQSIWLGSGDECVKFFLKNGVLYSISYMDEFSRIALFRRKLGISYDNYKAN